MRTILQYIRILFVKDYCYSIAHTYYSHLKLFQLKIYKVFKIYFFLNKKMHYYDTVYSKIFITSLDGLSVMMSFVDCEKLGRAARVARIFLRHVVCVSSPHVSLLSAPLHNHTHNTQPQP